MRYEEQVIEEVRERNDIVDVISSYVTLKKRGGSYFGLCPFHNEKSPSFHVDQNRQMYYCFGCGQGGNVYTFLMEYNRMTFPEALKHLADRAGIKLPEQEMSPEKRREADARSALREMNKQAAIYYNYLLKSSRGSNAMNYLKSRGLTDETINHFGLGYSDIYSDDLYRYLQSKGFTDYQMKDSSLVVIDSVRGNRDRFYNRVMFPIMDPSQRVIGFGGRVMGDGQPKYLNSNETILFDKGRNLYGLNYARRSRNRAIILCEGYMDVISLHQAGFTNAVAPLGTAFTPGQALLLKRYTEEVILSFDSDGAGKKAALRALPILRDNGLKASVLIMTPYKDPDELIKAEGAEAYQKRIEEAHPGRMFELNCLSENYDQKNPDSRTEFIHAAAKNLSTIEDSIERDNYVTAAANRFMINRKELEKLVERYGMSYQLEQAGDRYRKEPETRERREEKKKMSKNQPQRILLTWLTDYPELYPVVSKVIGPDDFLTPLYHSVAIMLFDQLEQGEELKPARIIDRFTDAEDQKEVASLFHAKLDFGVSEEDRDKALTDVVRKVKLASIEDQMVHTSDIVEWQKLIRQKKDIQELELKR